MKKLNITKEHFENSRYFTKKYGTLEYVSESGKVFKTSKGKLLKFSESMHPVLSNQDIDLAFKKGVHSCAEEINNGIKKILEYYTMPSYNQQSEAFKTAFEEIIPFKHNIEAILKLTES